MKFGLALVGLVAMLSGCSRSSADLLAAGDSHVCTKADVQDKLLNIIKENAHLPMDAVPSQDFKKASAEWLSKISMTLDQVTSSSIDKDNGKIGCNSRLILTATGVDGVRQADVDYQIALDLSKTDSVIVSANIAPIVPEIDALIAIIVGPAVRQARITEQAAKDARAKAYQDQWNRENAGAIAAYHEQMNEDWGGKELKGDPFVDQLPVEQRRSISKAEELNDQCRGGTGDTATIEKACKQRDTAYTELEAAGVCWGPAEAIGADQHWIRCP